MQDVGSERESVEKLRANYEWWEERARKHLETGHYRRALETVRTGGSTISELEETLTGPVAGLRMLHVGCHLGFDTISWARTGAVVTGLDFSREAIRRAERLAVELGVKAKWVCAEASNMPASFADQFDLVVASEGVLSWIPCVVSWFHEVARVLSQSGRFILVDGHPLLHAFDRDQAASGIFNVAAPLMGGKAYQRTAVGSYIDRALPTESNSCFGWFHGVGEIVTASVLAGLRIDHLAEHAWCTWPKFDNMLHEGGKYVLESKLAEGIPLSLSLVSRKADEPSGCSKTTSTDR